MATEKFFVFNESGTLKRLKGRIVRFLDNEDPDNADKVAIRSSLSVPASAEGLTPANNLSDLDSAATARTNLSVNSIDEDAQANALKVTAPSMHFNGTSSVVTVAHDAKLSFTDGTDDLPFSISAWVNMDDATNFVVASKFTTVSGGEWMLNCEGDDLRLYLQTSSGNSMKRLSASAITGYEGQWVHLAATYAGTSGGVFSSAGDGITLFVNGQPVAMDAAVEAGTYAGMANGTQAVRIGSQQSVFSKGSIRDCKIFNRTLTDSEVAELARGNDLGFSEEWAGALGGVFTQDSTPSGEFTSAGGADADLAGPLVGKSNVLRFTANTSTGTHSTYTSSSLLAAGKRYRVSGYVHIASGQTNIDGFKVVIGTSPVINVVATEASPTLDAWTFFSGEIIGASDGRVRIYASEGGATSFTDAGGDDTFEVAELAVTEIGTLADFRAEDYNESASKLLDRSSNNFVGVGTSVTLTGNQRHISADTIDLKNLPTSSAGLSAGEVWSNGGVLTVV